MTETRIGYKLFAEATPPRALVHQAARAEEAGFDFVEISDHFHPWPESQGHSAFAWSVLANIAARTERVGLVTGVTCPFMRYHPALVAQMAAPTAILSDGRFTLGLGSGENLNEHVVAQGWPPIRVRHAMLREAIEIIRLLWSGGFHHYEGEYLELNDARVFDLPDELPDIVVAAGGPDAAAIAGTHGDGLFATSAKRELVTAFTSAGGNGPRYAEVTLAWGRDDESALRSAHELSRFGALGWPVNSELPNPSNFEAAAQFVTADGMREHMSLGADVDAHVAAVKEYTDAGFDHVVLMNVGPDQDAFFDAFASQLGTALRNAV